jgi:hypothetical protein
MFAKIFKCAICIPFQSLPDVFVFFECHLRSSIYPNPDKPEKFFITKARKYENTKKIIIKLRAFLISYFRDCFYFFATKNTKFTIKILTLQKSVSINGQAG